MPTYFKSAMHYVLHTCHFKVISYIRSYVVRW